MILRSHEITPPGAKSQPPVKSRDPSNPNVRKQIVHVWRPTRPGGISRPGRDPLPGRSHARSRATTNPYPPCPQLNSQRSNLSNPERVDALGATRSGSHRTRDGTNFKSPRCTPRPLDSSVGVELVQIKLTH